MTSDIKYASMPSTLFALQNHHLYPPASSREAKQQPPETPEHEKSKAAAFLEHIDLEVPPDHLVEETIDS